MAEKEMTKEQKEAQEREESRELQLGLLNSESVRNLYVASQGRNTQNYGDMGKSATQGNYLQGLSNPDEYLARITSSPYLQSAMEAQKNGQDIYESGVSASHMTLLNNTAGIYQSAIDKVKVSDMLKMLNLENVHEKNISQNAQNMFMEDFAKKNKDFYNLLKSSYLGTVADSGVAQAIMENRGQQNKNLESLLAKDPDEGKVVQMNTNQKQAA